VICGNCKTFRTRAASEMLGHFGRCRDARWKRVLELRAQGDLDQAARLIRKILGVQGPPMDEEKKAELRAWKEEHKDEILAKNRQKREVRRRTLAILSSGRRR
jgi:hypothetical protein